MPIRSNTIASSFINALSHDHHFKWWFAISPVRADYLLRLKGGYRKHCYHRPLKEARLFHFFFFSFFLLFLYISLNCFLRDISHGCYIIAACLKCSVPLTTLIWMYIIYHQGTFPFQISHKFRYTQFGRNTYA